MKQAILEGIHQLVLKEVPKPEIERPDQVLVRIKAATICGADVHMLQGEHPPNQSEFPSPIGHEGAGIVEAVGDWIRDFKPGDRVGTTEWIHGCMAEYALTTPDTMIYLPDDMSFEHGAALELMQSIYSLSSQCFALGQTVVVLGQGPAGLLFTQTARAAGAYRIIASEPLAAKRELAARLGADIVVDPHTEDIVAVVQKATDGEMAHVVIETSGSPEVYPLLSSLLQQDGTVGHFGTSMGTLPFDFWNLHVKQLRVVATGRPPGYGQFSYQMGLRLVKRGLVDLNPIVTHRFPLSQVLDAYALASAGREDVLKVAVLP